MFFKPLVDLGASISIGTNDVILLTGGARGVTAEVAVAFAEACQPTLILLGRSAPPAPEDAGLNDAESEADIKPDSLARFAIESVRIKPDKNGIRYLRQNIERNLITPFTYAYRDQILRQSGAKDLLEAEKVLLERK